MNDQYFIVRQQPAVDLIDLARQGALMLAVSGEPGADALADAMKGAAAELAADIAEPVLS